ncbi:MAG: precorrin-4 C(11)-methyltransferase, partial [Synergistaceae bacterium]|nr:precorrin-4 C(11)-methyltransferase [Synergistaceae bacterium]
MVHFIGAGPGAPDLITLRGAKLLSEAGMIIYAGSLVNPELLKYAKEDCIVYDSASMTLDEVIAKIQEASIAGIETVRLHTGDPSIYGAIREQIDMLKKLGIPYDITPGVSSFCAAAAAAEAEYTLPSVSQTVIISRMEGRTPVPDKEKIRLLASHQASMVLFLSAGLISDLSGELLAGGYMPETKAAIVYKASWPEEKVIRTTISGLSNAACSAGIKSTALVMVGDFLGDNYDLSKLYDKNFSHGFRK